ncbi:hypothetical protein DFH11DRAFT_971438 [Phellopilus nigrolimitatus]|nr:hypothetical protein DFH11DRAFT_971438 [Phellopilus nigrolimitatus]
MTRFDCLFVSDRYIFPQHHFRQSLLAASPPGAGPRSLHPIYLATSPSARSPHPNCAPSSSAHTGDISTAPTPPRRGLRERSQYPLCGVQPQSLKSYDTALLPGGGLFLVNWAAGHIQCFSVPDGECIWTHRPGALTVERFGYDMQENGDVHVLVVSRPPGIDTGSRNLEIIQVSPQTRSTRQLYKCKTEDISDTERFVSLRFAKLSGDVLVICMEDYLLLTYWKENRSIVIRGSIFD